MFAERMKYLESSGIRRMFELKLKMTNPIDFSLGQPDFDVPQPVKDATIQAIREGKNGYTVTSGAPAFRDAVTQALAKEGVTPEAVIGTAGASGGLLLALLTLADERTEVLVADPCFATYGHLIRVTMASPRLINTYPDLRLTPERLRQAVSPRSRILLFNSPVNPTGIAYTPKEIEELAKTAKTMGLQVIADEVYDRFCYDWPHECWLKHDPGAILIRAFSKTWGMPGWRAGFAAGPREIIDQMNMLQQFTFVCMNSPAQYGAVAALNTDMSEILEGYRRKRDLIYQGLSGDFRMTKPEGAFYAFVEAPQQDAATFVQRCIEREVLVVPGGAFSRRNTHFRLSYATDDDTLKRGIDALVKIAREMGR